MASESSDTEEVQTQPATPAGLNLNALYSGKMLALIVVVVAFSVVTLLIVEATGGAQKFRDMVEGAGVWAPLVYVLLKASTYVIAPLSGTTVKLASGALFGVWDGMVLSLLGDTLGGVLNYGIARSLGRKGVTKFAGKKALRHVDATAERVGGWKVLLGARLLLSPIYDFISYAAGLARFPFTQFLLVTAIGGIPISIIFAFLGDATVTNGSVMRIFIILSVVVFVAAGISYLVQRRQKPASKQD
jgi:uncharacterized membrane protein YdjX (TVP38/TMEM64 family)